MGNCRDITCFDLGYYAYESSKHIDQTINDFAILAKHLVCSTYAHPFTCNHITQTVAIKDIQGFKTNIL